jgi:hypothetical protein
MKWRSKKTIQRINEIKSCFFEKINNIDESLANLTKMRQKGFKLVKLETKNGP